MPLNLQNQDTRELGGRIGQDNLRLRWLEQSGFLLRKVETYDSRYREAGNAYEWAMPTGGHGLSFASPRLIITSRRVGGTMAIALPPPLRVAWAKRQKSCTQATTRFTPICRRRRTKLRARWSRHCRR